jgi:uracil-DNA glycosylase
MGDSMEVLTPEGWAPPGGDGGAWCGRVGLAWHTLAGMIETLPAEWRSALGPRLSDAAIKKLDEFVFVERVEAKLVDKEVFPPDEDVFAALRLTPPDKVRAVILGQDPYYRPGQASGLAFSVRAGVDRPRSLVNIIKELETDLGHPVPADATLEPWARNGVLLLNTALTVREGLPNSHRRQWKAFTAAIVAMLAERPVPLAFLLWGEEAKSAGQKIDRTRHIVVKSAHPSPLSAKGFIGSAPFRKTNVELVKRGLAAIDWELG